MNFDELIKKAIAAYDAETSQVAKAFSAGYLNGLTICDSEIKRLRKAIEEHKAFETSKYRLNYRLNDEKLWEVLK